MKKLFNKEDGFTIIEVVLVLAIAGLIFLVVFLALPQLQRSRRDTQRRSDVGRILASLETYSSNHNGAYPGEGLGDTAGEFGATTADSDAFMGVYFGSDNFDDPSDDVYENIGPLSAAAGGAPAVAFSRPGELSYVYGDDCTGASGSRYVSVTMMLEQDTFCQDNR